MWFEKIAGLVIGQIALSVLLALVLWLVWARLRREQHLGFWALSWAVTAVYVGSLAGYVLVHRNGSSNLTLLTGISLLGVALAWCRPACLLLAAWSLWSGHTAQRRVWFTFAIAILSGVVWLAAFSAGGGWTAGTDPIQRLQFLVAPRTFLDAAGVACYALCFRRYYSRARGFSGWLTIGFCLAYSAHLLLVALGDIGIRWYGDPNGLLNSTMATIVPIGITLGIVISVLEQAQHSEGAVRSIWNSSMAMRLTDSQGHVVSVNPAFCAMMGRTREQMVGRLFTECYERSLAGPLLERYRTRFASRTVEPRVRRSFRRWDGKELEAELTNAFVESPSGPQLLSLMQDTTRELETSEALQRSEERLQLLLDSITDAVFDFRTDGSPATLAPRIGEMLGYQPGELTENINGWLSLLHPEDRATLPANPLDGLGASGNLTQWEYRLRHKTGRWVWIRSVARAIGYNDVGCPLRVVGTLTDISEDKAAEAQTRRLESELLQTRKMEAIGRLAGGVAHDFNNHLTVINGYCDLLLEVTSDPKLRDTLAHIRGAGARAAALTQQLLAVSRRQAVQPQPVHLNLLVTESGKMLQRLIGENIEIVNRLDPALGLVEADPGQMHQVLMNLTLNARDAMPGGGRITIETSAETLDERTSRRPREAKPGPYARLSVIDTGHGMQPETLEHIFEPFYTTKEAGAGTGLGLSTVYGIVQQAGGWIEAESAPSQGSTFRIHLPILENVPEAAVTETRAAEVRAGTETILVVEDDTNLRRVAVEILRENGYRLLEAGTGDEALSVSKAWRGPIHLLFTDVVMPGMTGPELARLIRELRPATRVLYSTGYSLGSCPAALGDGAFLLTKPFSPVELCSKVRDVLDGAEEPGTILVVDDEEGVRMLICEVLAEAGYRVRGVENAQSCFRCLEGGGVRLVITDLVLGAHDGLDIVRRIQKTQPLLPVIVMSGAAAGSAMEAALHLGARAMLQKPIDPKQLLAVVGPIMGC